MSGSESLTSFTNRFFHFSRPPGLRFTFDVAERNGRFGRIQCHRSNQPLRRGSAVPDSAWVGSKGLEPWVPVTLGTSLNHTSLNDGCFPQIACFDLILISKWKLKVFGNALAIQMLSLLILVACGTTTVVNTELNERCFVKFLFYSPSNCPFNMYSIS